MDAPFSLPVYGTLEKTFRLECSVINYAKYYVIDQCNVIAMYNNMGVKNNVKYANFPTIIKGLQCTIRDSVRLVLTILRNLPSLERCLRHYQ